MGTIQYPMLTKTNYPEWELMMTINLQAVGLWAAIEPGGVEYSEDRLALAAIARSVPPEMLSTVGRKSTAKDAWDTIKIMRMGVDRVREGNAQTLRRDFNNITFKDGESVDDFYMRITSLVNNLRVLGDTKDETEVVRKILQVVPERLEQVAISIETLLDVGTMTVEEVIGRLRAVEQRLEARKLTAELGSRLLLSTKEEEMITQLRRQEKEGVRRGNGKFGGGNFPGGGSNRNNNSGGSRPGFLQPSQGRQSPRKATKEDQCHYCKKYGHWQRDCRKKQRNEAAHLVQTHEEDGEEGPILMMAQVAPNPSPLHSELASEHEHQHVFLNEVKATVELGNTGKVEQTRGVWYLDTGASNHMTGNIAVFSNLDRGITGTVKFGDDSLVDIHGRGTIIFSAQRGSHRVLSDVYYIPSLRSNIISLGQLDENGCQVLIEQGVLRVRDPGKDLLVKVKRSQNRLYKINLTIAQPISFLARTDDVAWRWHERYGHLGFEALRKLSRDDMVRGMPQLDHVDQLCDACLVGKQRRTPFPQEAKYRATGLLDLVHGDLCGPVTPATHGGRRYFLLLVDDLSRYLWLILLASKDEAAAAIKKFQAGVEVETGRKLRALRTDRGGEFTSVTFGDYCAEKGVQRQLTAPYSPQQNGVVERKNQSVMSMARCLLKAKAMPSTFWGEAVCTAVFILNRSPTKALQGKTPYEVWHGKKPAVHFMRTFGCIAHVKVTRPHAKKLDDRSIKMVFVGYEPGTKGYRVYNPENGRLYVTRDVIFDETKGWNWANYSDNSIPETYTVGYLESIFSDGGIPKATEFPVASNDSAHGEIVQQTPVVEKQDAGRVKFASPPSHVPSEIGFDDEGAPRRYRMVADCMESAKPIELNPNELFLVASEEPNTYEEAQGDVAWQAAMKEEMAAIAENGTWSLADLPAGHRPIGLKWVFKLKKDASGAVVRHKARLVAKGYVQRAGIDFEEAFAPVARLDSVRTLIAVAAHEGWVVHHLDVKSAFLNGDLVEEVYVTQPPGFVVAGHERQVLKLNKALYGLRQAPRAWNMKLDHTLGNLGFTRCTEEHGIYTRGEGRKRVLLGVYVDDLIITGADQSEVDAFKEEMKHLFKMSDLGRLSYYLGIEVKQKDGRITLAQGAYAAKLLEKAGMSNCNIVHTPMENRLKLSKKTSSPSVDSTYYRSIVGSLRYLVHTRPDICFAVGYVSRFMENPTMEHLSAVKHILRYVAGTLHYGLCYIKGLGEFKLYGYSDADMAGDVDDCKSTTGVLFCFGNKPVTWCSQKQTVVALSSCEAEYIAASSAVCQGLWLGSLLGSLYGKGASVATILIDNQSAIQLCKNPVFHGRSKHIKTRFHFIRESVEGGEVVVEKVHTNDQLADIFTKSLGRVRFLELRSKIGIINVHDN